MLLPRLAQFAAAVVFLLGSVSAAEKAMDMKNSIKRDTATLATVVNIGEMGFTPRSSPRSLFEKRATCDSSNDNICDTTSLYIYCCPSGKICFNNNGSWVCQDDVLSGLTKGQKIGIAVGILVAFFIIAAAALAIFCYCCRKGAQIATAAAVAHQNNNNNTGGGMYYPPQQPVQLYGNVQQQPTGYNNQGGQDYQTAIPLIQQTPMGGEKPYTDQPGRNQPFPQEQGQYPQQQGYNDQYGGQSQYAYPPQQQSTQTPAPPYNQPPVQQQQQLQHHQ